jgi:hypothetical protein
MEPQHGDEGYEDEREARWEAGYSAYGGGLSAQLVDRIRTTHRFHPDLPGSAEQVIRGGGENAEWLAPFGTYLSELKDPDTTARWAAFSEGSRPGRDTFAYFQVAKWPAATAEQLATLVAYWDNEWSPDVPRQVFADSVMEELRLLAEPTVEAHYTQFVAEVKEIVSRG